MRFLSEIAKLLLTIASVFHESKPSMKTGVGGNFKMNLKFTLQSFLCPKWISITLRLWGGEEEAHILHFFFSYEALDPVGRISWGVLRSPEIGVHTFYCVVYIVS